MFDYEVVGFVDTKVDKVLCLDCLYDNTPTKHPIFAGRDDALTRCERCGDWLLGEAPEELKRDLEVRTDFYNRRFAWCERRDETQVRELKRQLLTVFGKLQDEELAGHAEPMRENAIGYGVLATGHVWCLACTKRRKRAMPEREEMFYISLGMPEDHTKCQGCQTELRSVDQ